MSYVLINCPSVAALDTSQDTGNKKELPTVPRGTQWEKDSLVLRDRAGVSPGFKPWTARPEFEARGIKLTERIRDLMDCTVIERAVANGLTMSDCVKSMSDCFLDYSQSHSRRCYTVGGINKCLTTSSTLYSYGADRAVLPVETLRFHGYPTTLNLPHGITAAEIKEFSGEAMCLPCLACVLWSILIHVPLASGTDPRSGQQGTQAGESQPLEHGV